MDLIVLGYFIFWLVTVSRWKWKSHQTGTVLLSWPLATSCYLKGYSPVQNTSKNIPSLGLIERPSLSLDNNNDDIRNKSQTSFSHQTLASPSFGFTPHISLSLSRQHQHRLQGQACQREPQMRYVLFRFPIHGSGSPSFFSPCYSKFIFTLHTPWVGSRQAVARETFFRKWSLYFETRGIKSCPKMTHYFI